ncbi:MAG: SIS domain-containing protein [bacterium]
MIREIREQPEALERMYARERKKVERIGAEFGKRAIRFIMLAARGSSDNAAVFGKYLIEYRNGIPCVLAAPSIFTVYGGGVDMKGGAVIGVSQSGEGTDVVATLARARERGAFAVAVTNSPASPITEAAHEVVFLHAGREKALAATKTYTCQLLAMMMLSAALRRDKRFTRQLEEMPGRLRRVLSIEPAVRDLAGRYRYMSHCAVIGRGFNYATVREASLKLMETCYTVAQPFSTADFLHGPIAMTGEGFPVFLCAAEGKMLAPMRGVLAGLNRRRCETVVVSFSESILGGAAVPVKMPFSPPEAISPIFYIAPFQFLAHYCALAKGIDPDNPRYLRKITRTF